LTGGCTIADATSIYVRYGGEVSGQDNAFMGIVLMSCAPCAS
jgi:hypothetical protein